MLDPQLFRLAETIYEERLKEAERERFYREFSSQTGIGEQMRHMLTSTLQHVDDWLRPHHHTPGSAMPMGGAHGHA